MKLEDAVSKFLRDHEVSKNTHQTYAAALLPMVTALGAQRNIRNVSVMDIKDYAYDLTKKNVHGKSYSQGTITHYQNVIKVFFRWAVQCGLIKSSPAEVLKSGKTSAKAAETKAATTEEITLLLEYARWNKRLYALILFLAHTGCRAGGAAGLRVKDVDFERGEAVVTEKGNKTRRVIFGPSVGQAIKTWLNSRDQKYKVTPSQSVFSIGGQEITSKAITALITRACDSAGIRHMGAHAMRHHFGHMMALSGVPASLTALFMGHTDPSITLKIYYPRDLETGRHLWESYVSNAVGETPREEVDNHKILHVDFRQVKSNLSYSHAGITPCDPILWCFIYLTLYHTTDF